MITHSKPTLNNNDYISVNKVLQSGLISSNKLNNSYKNKLGVFLKKEFVSLFSSGSTALFFALKALSNKQKKKVLLPNYICGSVYKAVILSGLEPVLYDNEPNSWISSYNQIVKKITNDTLVVIINHTFGIRINEIKKISDKGVLIIEDCCHAFSSCIKGERISKYSICSFYSFDATKWLTTGNGGAIATNDESFFKEIEKNKLDQGLPDILCALGLIQLEKIHEFKKRREFIAHTYFKEMPDITKDLYRLPSVFFRFPILTDNSTSFFKSKLVSFRKGVDILLSDKFNIEGNYENSKDIFNRTISIPIYPSLTDKQLSIIINETKKHYYEGNTSL